MAHRSVARHVWKIIRPGRLLLRKGDKYVTSNAHIESVHERLAFRDAWRRAQRSVIPAARYAEPRLQANKSVGRCLRRVVKGIPWVAVRILVGSKPVSSIPHWTDGRPRGYASRQRVGTCLVRIRSRLPHFPKKGDLDAIPGSFLLSICNRSDVLRHTPSNSCHIVCHAPSRCDGPLALGELCAGKQSMKGGPRLLHRTFALQRGVFTAWRPGGGERLLQ